MEMMYIMELKQILTNHSAIALLGNKSTGKTMSMLTLLLNLKIDKPKVNIAVMGINAELEPYLKQHGIIILKSEMDILDLRLTNTLIFIDEIAMFFDSKASSKQEKKLARFFDRIEHQKCKVIIGTTREKYFNGLMCSRVTCAITKEVEYDSLVNGTWIKERIMAIVSPSDYRLEISPDTYFLVSKKGETTVECKVEYDAELDTKKSDIDFFGDRKDCEEKDENSDEFFCDNISEKYEVSYE